MSHPDDIRRRKDVRTEIRRHVMKDIGQQRRRPRPPKRTALVLPHTSSQQPNYSSQLRSTNPSNNTPSRSLAPLGSFPIEADSRVLELLNFAAAAPYQPFRDIWIEVAFCDPGAFHTTLGNTADFLRRINGKDSSVNSREISSHYALSVAQLRRRLGSVAESTSEGAIANVLAHVCLTMRRCDWENWRVHMNGLTTISRIRGGFNNLRRQILILILMYDLAGAMVFDSSPRFALPTDILGRPNTSLRGVPPRLQTLLLQLEQMPCDVSSAGEALRMTSTIADVININSYSTSFWKRDMDAIIMLGPCIHFLLSIPRLSNSLDTTNISEDLIAREIVRLVCLVIMSTLKESFAFFASERVALQAKVSRFVPQNAKRLGEKYFELRIWALVTAALLQQRDERGVYIQELRREMRALGVSTPHELLEIARGIIWIDILMSPCADELMEDMKLDVAYR
ncbi:hypothetical protein AK830_g10862 [Neonectria ditissima]|uniref:Transcription factor domain-containing protein n=1 Tax=Neonectria ditissima TaxID=78410 RepID=A0A0N8H5B5_9HYPO|nr:hypothetical protein AK830_g10862 [Neonectria ditissima]